METIIELSEIWEHVHSLAEAPMLHSMLQHALNMIKC